MSTALGIEDLDFGLNFLPGMSGMGETEIRAFQKNSTIILKF
jgi:hypothetical protein